MGDMPVPVICIMGPTASGKTDLALSLAKQLPCDIISVDSAMVYRTMNIGSAKPSIDMLAQVSHRLIDICDPTERYSAGKFCEDAAREIKNIAAQNRIPLLVGGTMLYFHKLQHGIANLPSADSLLREKIFQEGEEKGWSFLHGKLQSIDPVASQKIKPQDKQRIQRALEIYYLTGKPISQLQKETETSLSNCLFITIGLIPENRQWLHQRIASRFDHMLQAGFLEEVKKLFERSDIDEQLPSMRMVGYRQAWKYLSKEIDFDTMKIQAVAATRQLAKRQLTWLRSWSNLITVDPCRPQLDQIVLREIKKYLKS